MSQLYGVALQTTVQKLLVDVKFHFARKNGVQYTGNLTLSTLRNAFQKLDFAGSMKLDVGDFEKALSTVGIFFKKVDFQALLKYYDLDGDKYVNYGQFLQDLRCPLNERRFRVVSKVLDVLDPERTGVLSVQSLLKNYDAILHKDVVNKRKSSNEVTQEFLSNFPQDEVNQDQFVQYYEEVSVGIPSDKEFVDLIQNEWQIKEDNTMNQSNEEAKALVKLIRQKLIQTTQGAHDEYRLRALFKEFDVNQTGQLSFENLQRIMFRLEIPMNNRCINMLFSKFDKNQNGEIDFEEFVFMIGNDAYN